MNIRAILFSLGIFTISFLMHPFFAAADDGKSGISVSPMFQDIILNLDETSQTFTIDATNTTDSLITLRMSLLDFGSLDESGGVAFLGAEQNLEKKYSIASWIRLDRDALVLGSGESQSVQVTIENRETLSPGGHYGAVVFKVENSGADAVDENGKPSIAVNQSFSSLIFAKKLGGEIYDLDMRSAEPRYSWMHLPESISMRFQNKGNVHVVPRGIVTLTNPLGSMVQKGIINQESAIILPETFRSFVVRPLDIATAFIPGYYTLSMQYRYDGKADFTIQTQRFFFLPPVVLMGMMIIVGLIIWKRKHKKYIKN